MRWVAQFVARAAGRLSRLLGRGGGTTVPGVVLLRIRPRAAEELVQSLSDGAVVISATNGKTTTARLLRSATDMAEISTVANTAGSNLLRGVTAALLDGDKAATLGLFEVDEAALPSVVDQLEPRVVVLMNLFRDQLDRYGELESLVTLWHEVVRSLPDATVLILNADDPAVAYLGHDRANTVYFGVDDRTCGRPGLAHAADSIHCPRCDTALEYDMVAIGHVGHWRCPSCGLARPTPHVAAASVNLKGTDGFEVDISTPAGPVVATVSLPGLHNAYNATAAVATALEIAVPVEAIGPGLEATSAAFGRGERIPIDGHELVLLLAKNPAGANENVRTALSSEGDVHVMVLLNDRTADGQDVSWIWDVDYEPLFDRLASLTLSGDRAHDLALRFVYGGFPSERIAVQPDIAGAIDLALEASSSGSTIYVLPTYTAMLDLRTELVQRGVTHQFWEDQ